MTAPDFIWADDYHWIDYAPTRSDRLRASGDYTPYVRRDPAVIAELPEVRALVNPLSLELATIAERDMWRDKAQAAEREAKALVAAALQRAVELLQLRHSNYMRAKGRNPDDYGSEYSLIAAELLALIDTDHAAALEAVKAHPPVMLTVGEVPVI